MMSHTITVAELRGLREFAGEDKNLECRYGVALLDDGRAAATDGITGAIIGVDPAGPEDPMHRPLVLTGWSPSSAPLVPLPTIEKLLKGAGAKSRIRWQRTVDSGVLVERLSNTGAVEVESSVPAALTVFPPLWRVCGYDGRGKPTGEIAMSSVLLARLAVVERALPKHKNHVWRFRFGGPLDALIAEPEGRYEGRPWIVAVMPCRL